MIQKIKNDGRFVLIFISSFVWGLLAHGMAMFNKYSYHDDVPHYNGVGVTYELGRWFLAISGKFASFFFGSKNYSLPAFEGVITIAAIAAMTYIICLKLRIENKVLIVALTSALVCFPAVTNIFGYVYTAPYYYIGALAGVAGAYIFYKKKSLPAGAVCATLMALSVGIYQSNIPINLMVLLLFMLDEVYCSDMDLKEFITLAFKNILICVIFMAEYFAANALALGITGLQLYDYKAVSSFGLTSPVEYLVRIITAYKRFVKPADFINYNNVSANMFPWNTKYVHMLLVLVIAVLLVLLLRSVHDVKKIIQICIITVLSPLFAYFIYVMVSEEDAHGGMTFGESFMFFFAAYVIERAGQNDRIKRFLSKAAVVLMLVIGVMFARYANVCYLKADLMQTEAINYYNRLIAQIQSVEGYTTETPVLYIGGRNKNDDGFSGDSRFDPIYLPPYQNNSIINDFSWEETMELWCSFAPQMAGPDAIESWDVIDGMPNYPDAGSVRMVDGTIVVKFADSSD